jgi:pyruvate,water dikinase
VDGVTFAPPGPGSWTLEKTHFQRPLARFGAAALLEGLSAGMAESTARYGLLIEGFGQTLVNGFVYEQVVPFGADGTTPPEEVQERVRRSERAFAERWWRADLDRWDRVDKPAAVAAHRGIQAVDPAGLSDEELAAHLRRCLAHLREMAALHQRYAVGAVAPVGEFLACAQEWTGASPGELTALLRGTSGISTGFAADELDALVTALHGSPSARKVLAAGDPATATLDALVADPDAGPAARAYLDAVRFRSVGYDVGDATAGEMPELLVGAIRAAADGAGAAPPDDRGHGAVRARVPEEHRAAFDALLAEARLVNRLRDERAVYSDGWATGLARRAALEAGRRLHGAGRLRDPEHAVDADVDELGALLRGGFGPDAGEVAARFRWRTRHTVDDVPEHLGDPPPPPAPPDALPPQARRAARAAGAVLMHMFAVSDAPHEETVVRGIAVHRGVYEGRARLVETPYDFSRLRHGDVLVTRSTSPYFNVVLPLIGALVTDRGGQLCHAAIVAREFGIPGVVGTRDGTRRIRDGARVRVDGTAGEVRLLD